MSQKELSKEMQLVADLFDVAMKLRYENAHMRAILKRLGIEPQFPEYRDYKPAERKSA